MRKAIIAVLYVATVCWMLSAPGVAEAIDCKTPLVSHSKYRCDFKRENGSTLSACTDFVAFPEEGKFYWAFPLSQTLFHCTCQALGTFSIPRFDLSPAFLCGHFDHDQFDGDAAIGKVIGTAIKYGQYFSFSTAQAFVYECHADPTCE